MSSAQGPKDLLEQSLAGNHEAGLEFANIIYQGKYEGDLNRASSKKEAKELNRSDALQCIIRGAIDGFIPSIIEAAEACFLGRVEQKKFGGKVIPVSYSEAFKWYSNLVDIEGIDVNLRALSFFRLGMCKKILGQFESNIDWESVVEYWNKGAQLEGYWSDLSKASIGEYYYSVTKEYSRAIPILEETNERVSSAAGTLSHAHRFGNGVRADIKKAQDIKSVWEKLLDEKK